VQRGESDREYDGMPIADLPIEEVDWLHRGDPCSRCCCFRRIIRRPARGGA